MAPRRVLLITMCVLGGGLGEFAYRLLDAQTLAIAATFALQACLFCIGGVWAMRGKADAYLHDEGADAQGLERRHEALGQVWRRSLLLCVALAVATLPVAGVLFTKQLTREVHQWMVIATGVAVAASGYGLWLAAEWERQLRAFRHSSVLERKRREERAALAQKIKLDDPLPGSSMRWSVGDPAQLQPVEGPH